MGDTSRFADIIDDFKKDASKETGGVWMTFKRHQYLIARAHRNNPKFAKLFEERMRPYQWSIDRGNLAAVKDVANDVMQEIYAATILLGVRKLDGTALDYAAPDGVALFKLLPDLWDAVFMFAKDEGNYAPDQIELDSKN